MNSICGKCGKIIQAGARFCTGCGGMLGVTQLRGVTVVAPPASLLGGGAPSVSADGLQAVVERVRSTFGNAPLRAPGPSSFGDLGQRELTIFANDGSGSMNESYVGARTKLEGLIRATVKMTVSKGLQDGQDEIGVVIFNSHATPLLSLRPIRTHKREIIAALQSMVASNGTDINEGLKAADAMLSWDRPDVVRRIVLLTDGLGGDPLRTAESLKKRGVVIDVIGIGESPRDVDEKLLRAVASVVQDKLRYRFIKDEPSLVSHYTDISAKTTLGA